MHAERKGKYKMPNELDNRLENSNAFACTTSTNYALVKCVTFVSAQASQFSVGLFVLSFHLFAMCVSISDATAGKQGES